MVFFFYLNDANKHFFETLLNLLNVD